jgi:hypothetical protein
MKTKKVIGVFDKAGKLLRYNYSLEYLYKEYSKKYHCDKSEWQEYMKRDGNYFAELKIVPSDKKDFKYGLYINGKHESYSLFWGGIKKDREHAFNSSCSLFAQFARDNNSETECRFYERNKDLFTKEEANLLNQYDWIKYNEDKRKAVKILRLKKEVESIFKLKNIELRKVALVAGDRIKGWEDTNTEHEKQKMYKVDWQKFIDKEWNEFEKLQAIIWILNKGQNVEHRSGWYVDGVNKEMFGYSHNNVGDKLHSISLEEPNKDIDYLILSYLTRKHPDCVNQFNKENNIVSGKYIMLPEQNRFEFHKLQILKEYSRKPLTINPHKENCPNRTGAYIKGDVHFKIGYTLCVEFDFTFDMDGYEYSGWTYSIYIQHNEQIADFFDRAIKLLDRIVDIKPCRRCNFNHNCTSTEKNSNSNHDCAKFEIGKRPCKLCAKQDRCNWKPNNGYNYCSTFIKSEILK